MGSEKEKIISSSKVIEKKDSCRKSRFRYTLENELNLDTCGTARREDVLQKEQGGQRHEGTPEATKRAVINVT